MEEFAKSLGFEFTTNRAYFTTVEKITEFAKGRSVPEDHKFSQLAVPLDRALEVA